MVILACLVLVAAVAYSMAMEGLAEALIVLFVTLIAGFIALAVHQSLANFLGGKFAGSMAEGTEDALALVGIFLPHRRRAALAHPGDFALAGYPASPGQSNRRGGGGKPLRVACGGNSDNRFGHTPLAPRFMGNGLPRGRRSNPYRISHHFPIRSGLAGGRSPDVGQQQAGPWHGL